MANNRIFYPVHMVAVKEDDGTTNFDYDDSVHGVQTMSMTTDFNLTQTNELGTQTIYANVEGVPNIQVSLSKALDGWPTPYLLATQKATAPTLIARSKVRSTIGAAVYPDDQTNSSGDATAVCLISGAFVDSISYNFSTDGNFTEDTTFVANDKLWYRRKASNDPTSNDFNASHVPGYGEDDLRSNLPSLVWNSYIPNIDSPIAPLGIATSIDFDFSLPEGTLTPDRNGAVDHRDCTVMPPEIAGFTTSGTNPRTGDQYAAHVSSFTCSVSLSREDLLELGRRGPYYRAATFPVEVTSELSATATEGDLVSALEFGIFGTGLTRCSGIGVNTKDRTIRVVLCEGLRLYLGTKNRLQSVGYSGGDAEGGNVTISYTYTNFNDFTVMHENDPHYTGNKSGPFYSWDQRNVYLQQDENA